MKDNKAGSILDKINVNMVSHNLFDELNKTDETIECELLHHLVIDTVKAMPNKIAIINGQEEITYKELHEKSNQVAHYILESGSKQGDKIGVLVPRETYSIINILGILKAGCVYVPIDPEYPDERKKYILEKSECKFLLDNQISEKIHDYEKTDVHVEMSIDSLAYTIYTSGSTGNPKGVEITHRAACNTILDIIGKFHITDEDKIIGLSSMCFDLSVFDIFGAFFVGATLVQIEDQRDVKLVIKTIEEQGVTIWNSIPSTMKMLIDNTKDKVKNTSLRLVLLSGDWIPMSLPDRIHNLLPSCEVISLGGATEASIWSIYYPVDSVDSDWASIPYGRPLANQKIYILNYEHNICPTGVEGEIAIGGVGVAKGYANDPDKTAASFINHANLGKIYLTGDYGVLNPKGYIEFRGRKDNQVKIRGYRVELGEVESVLSRLDGIDIAVVTSRNDSMENTYLCCYFISENEELSTDTVKNFAEKNLPSYMVPSKFMRLEKMPLTENGKIDRRNMPDPQESNIEKKEEKEYNDVIVNELIKMCNMVFGNDVSIKPEDNFFEIGINSILMVNILTQIEEKYGIQIKFKDFLKQNNIIELAELIKESNPKIQNEVRYDDQDLGNVDSNGESTAVQIGNVDISYNRFGAVIDYIVENISAKESDYFVVRNNNPLTCLASIMAALRGNTNIGLVSNVMDSTRIKEIQQSINAKELIDSDFVSSIPQSIVGNFSINMESEGDIKILCYKADNSSALIDIKKGELFHKVRSLIKRNKLTEADIFAVSTNDVDESTIVGIFTCFYLGAKLLCFDSFEPQMLNEREVTVLISGNTEHNCISSTENTLLFWSPIVNWKSTQTGIQIGEKIYKQDVYNNLMPELYFLAQDGITYTEIIEHFDHIHKTDLSVAIQELKSKKVLIDSILDVEDLFSCQDKLFQHTYGDDLLFKEEVYKKFKNEQLSRSLSYKGEPIRLGYYDGFPSNFTDRRSSRMFNQESEIPFETFCAVLNAFRQNGKNETKTYFYASAGGLYPVDVFIYVKKERVENISEGLYYYNPVKNIIVPVDRNNKITADAHYFTNKEIFGQSAFSLFFIYNAEVTMPRYSGAGYLYSLIDTGIMVATFTQVCQLMNLGACSIGDMNFDKIRPYFKLSNNQKLIHTVEVGLKGKDEKPVVPSLRINDSADFFDKAIKIESLRVIISGENTSSNDWFSDYRIELV